MVWVCLWGALPTCAALRETPSGRCHEAFEVRKVNLAANAGSIAARNILVGSRGICTTTGLGARFARNSTPRETAEALFGIGIGVGSKDKA